MLPARLREHVCPDCRSTELILDDTEEVAHGEIVNGVIRCSSCGNAYPIIRGIPRFVEPSNYADSFGFQWNRHAHTQLDSHTGRPISRERLSAALDDETDLSGQRILEAGSGAGRFTEVLISMGADVTTFDYSTAVDANRANQCVSAQLHFFQGNIFRIPLTEGSFDKVLCLGVLQHTPDPEAAFRSLVRYVKPGGQLIVDSYRRSIPALLQWKYILRPITRRMRKETLYQVVATTTPKLVPVARMLRRVGGRVGARLVPIVEYSHLGLAPEINKDWAILDTFDMYSPAHDHPQSITTVRKWFEGAGFSRVHVRHGFNGVVGSGDRTK